jgi:hypothetical protein
MDDEVQHFFPENSLILCNPLLPHYKMMMARGVPYS